jgi:small subunit ribosomal protein S20
LNELCFGFLCLSLFPGNPDQEENLPTTKTAEKEMRAAERRLARNKATRSKVKTEVAKAEGLIAAGNLETAKIEVKKSIKVLDKAGNKGIAHPNAVARSKSRLMKKLNQASAKKA